MRGEGGGTAGGESAVEARNKSYLYTYMYNRLLEANIARETRETPFNRSEGIIIIYYI